MRLGTGPAASHNRGMRTAWILVAALAACASPRGPAEPSATAELEAVLVELYAAFGFDPGEEPDWRTQRAIYLPGASFVPPLRPGLEPCGEDAEAFLASFREFVLSGPYRASGLHERIVELRLEREGRLAHAFVTFEGFAPSAPREALTRGVDGIQLVHDGARWRLASFATEYE